MMKCVVLIAVVCLMVASSLAQGPPAGGAPPAGPPKAPKGAYKQSDSCKDKTETCFEAIGNTLKMNEPFNMDEAAKPCETCKVTEVNTIRVCDEPLGFWGDDKTDKMIQEAWYNLTVQFEQITCDCKNCQVDNPQKPGEKLTGDYKGTWMKPKMVLQVCKTEALGNDVEIVTATPMQFDPKDVNGECSGADEFVKACQPFSDNSGFAPIFVGACGTLTPMKATDEMKNSVEKNKEDSEVQNLAALFCCNTAEDW